MSNNQPTTPTMYHVVEKGSDDKVQTVWSYNTYQAAVVQWASSPVHGGPSTFSIEPCPGTGCCPACIAVRRVEQ